MKMSLLLYNVELGYMHELDLHKIGVFLHSQLFRGMILVQF
jgi:hypothetical protein